MVQALRSSQTTGMLPVQTPPLHASGAKQALPSSQTAVLFTCKQPLAVSQLSSVQALLSSQLSTEPLVHLPPRQTSGAVQALPSEQGAALLLTCWQPLAGSQKSAVQPFLSSQLTCTAPPMHRPAMQWSSALQALLSLQRLALLLTYVQLPLAGSQMSSVQLLPSLHCACLPGVHLPATQTSPRVQALPSEHAPLLLAMNTQPLMGSQVSAVQGLPSTHCRPTPTQLPAVHVSPVVQTLPSSQG